jgi:hypothetical protein
MRLPSEEHMACALSPVPCRRCKQRGSCIIYRCLKNCEQLLETKWTKELKEEAGKLASVPRV